MGRDGRRSKNTSVSLRGEERFFEKTTESSRTKHLRGRRVRTCVEKTLSSVRACVAHVLRCIHSGAQHIMHRHEHSTRTYTHTPPQSTLRILKTPGARASTLGRGVSAGTHLSTTYENVHTHCRIEASENYAVVPSNTLCRNMNTLHRHLRTTHLHNNIDTHAKAVYIYIHTYTHGGGKVCTCSRMLPGALCTHSSLSELYTTHTHAYICTHAGRSDTLVLSRARRTRPE